VSSVSTHSSAITCTSHMTKSGVKIVWNFSFLYYLRPSVFF
jgi:hypothetical protein